MQGNRFVRSAKVVVGIGLIHFLVSVMAVAEPVAEKATGGEKIILPHGWRGMIQLKDLELAGAPGCVSSWCVGRVRRQGAALGGCGGSRKSGAG